MKVCGEEFEFVSGPNVHFYIVTFGASLLWGWKGLLYWLGFCALWTTGQMMYHIWQTKKAQE